MRTNGRVLAIPALVFLVLSPLQVQAQEVAREPVSHQHVISGSPLLLIAGSFNAEYERMLAESLTVGIAGGWLDLGEEENTSVTGFLRFYPQEAAFTGYYLGSRAGFYRVDDGGDPSNAFGIGVDIGYAWVLGPGRSFYVGLGMGATHLFSGNLGDASRTIPSLRVIDIGIAF